MPITRGPETQEGLISVSPQTLREMVPKLRIMMENIIPEINIIECPKEYAIYPSSIDDKMPEVRIGIATASDLDASKDIENIKNDLKNIVKISNNIDQNNDKINYYEIKIDKLAKYIEKINTEKVRKDSITILWGIFGEDFSASGFRFKTYLSPEWIMHDLIHLIENNPNHRKAAETRQVTNDLHKLPVDIMNHYKHKKEVITKFEDFIKSITPNADEDDFYATLGYIILNKPEDLMKIIPEFNSTIRYLNSGLHTAIEDLTGILHFLP